MRNIIYHNGTTTSVLIETQIPGNNHIHDHLSWGNILKRVHNTDSRLFLKSKNVMEVMQLGFRISTLFTINTKRIFELQKA